jgi:hypothetical protein
LKFSRIVANKSKSISNWIAERKIRAEQYNWIRVATSHRANLIPSDFDFVRIEIAQKQIVLIKLKLPKGGQSVKNGVKTVAISRKSGQKLAVPNRFYLVPAALTKRMVFQNTTAVSFHISRARSPLTQMPD